MRGYLSIESVPHMHSAQARQHRHGHLKIGPALLFVVSMLAGVTALHYLTSAHLLPYHSIYRSLYYLPIGIAAVTWGLRGGMIVALFTTAVYLPHVLLMGEAMPGGILDNVLEVLAFNAVAALTGALSDAQRRQRQRAETLRVYIDDVLAGLPVGVATADLHGALTAQNPAAVELLRSLGDPRHLPTELGYAELVLTSRPIGIRRSLLHAADGLAAGQVLVLEDLSEQRRLHEQVRRAERLSSLGQLAGGLAHEIRNPLAIVRAVAQLVSAKLQERSELHQHLKVLTAEADRIDQLIGELLAYGSSRPLQIGLLPVAPFVEEVVASLTPYAVQHGVALHVEFDAALPPLQADTEQLRRALVNVLLNAVQASVPGQTVHIRCYADSSRLCFNIRDYGSGIPAEIKERIFDPFFTTRDNGTGMGLAVVSRIVAEHGGTVEVHNAPNRGAVVTLCLPMNMEAVWPSGS